MSAAETNPPRTMAGRLLDLADLVDDLDAAARTVGLLAGLPELLSTPTGRAFEFVSQQQLRLLDELTKALAEARELVAT